MKFTIILYIFFRGKIAYQFITPCKEAEQVSLDPSSFTLNMNQSGFCIRTHSSRFRQLHTSVTGQSTGFVVLSLHNIQYFAGNFKRLLLVQWRLLPYYGAFLSQHAKKETFTLNKKNGGVHFILHHIVSVLVTAQNCTQFRVKYTQLNETLWKYSKLLQMK